MRDNRFKTIDPNDRIQNGFPMTESSNERDFEAVGSDDLENLRVQVPENSLPLQKPNPRQK